MTENKRFIGSSGGVYDRYKSDRFVWSEWEEIIQIMNNLNEKARERSKALSKLQKENEQLKQELKKYTDAFDCSQCRFQNYDWFDDGDEFEVCEKGNNEAQMENHSCSEWEEI